MSGKALWGGLKSYLGALLATILVPLLWLRAVRFARRHAGDDPRAPLKVGVAIAASVAIGAGGALLLLGFQANAVAGMYGSMDTRVAAAVGETAYQDNVAAVGAADAALPIIEANLATARRELDAAAAANASDSSPDNQGRHAAAAESVAKLEAARDAMAGDRAEAQAAVDRLGPNHALYGRLRPLVRDQDDAALRAEVARAGLAAPADMQAGVDAALAKKDQSVRDMQAYMWIFFWPSLAGAFLAPLAFAFGSILRKAFVPSDTVGFRPYPGGAAGLFLLFGAFGLPSVPFAAWVFLDAENRSREGQIAL